MKIISKDKVEHLGQSTKSFDREPKIRSYKNEKQHTSHKKKPALHPNLTDSDQIISLFRFNISFKLKFGIMVRVVLLLMVLNISVYAFISYYLYQTADTRLNELGNMIEENQLIYNDATLIDTLNAQAIEYYVYDQHQTQIYSNTDKTQLFSFELPYAPFNWDSFPLIASPYFLGIRSDTLSTPYYILTFEKITSLETTKYIFNAMAFFALLILLIMGTSVSKITDKQLKPIHHMTEDVREMSGNNLSQRLDVSGTRDELKDLALTFNQMLENIEQSYFREQQFVSDASHELRTPIAVIKGYAGMLNRWGKDDPDVLSESIEAIISETDNMQSLVENLLFIAKNDKGTLKMVKAPFDLSHLVNEVIRETKLIDAEHVISSQVENDIQFVGAQDKLKQAMRIFVDNSIKYTPQDGEVHIGLRQSEHQITLEFSDSGIGIAKEDIAHVFERFYRADKSRTKLENKTTGGSGLGLAIAKIIIDQHQGKIEVKSDIHSGTTFIVRLTK